MTIVVASIVGSETQSQAAYSAYAGEKIGLSWEHALKNTITPGQMTTLPTDSLHFSGTFTRRALLRGGLLGGLLGMLPEAVLKPAAGTPGPVAVPPKPPLAPPSPGVALQVMVNASRQSNGYYDRQLDLAEREYHLRQARKAREEQRNKPVDTSVRAKILAGFLKAQDGTYDRELEAYAAQLLRPRANA